MGSSAAKFVTTHCSYVLKVDVSVKSVNHSINFMQLYALVNYIPISLLYMVLLIILNVQILMSAKKTVQMNVKASVTTRMVATSVPVMKEECYPMTNITVSMHVVGR